MQAVVQLAENIVTAVAVTYNPTSAQQQRAEAVQFLEQVKKGDVHTVVPAVANLTDPAQPLEVQVAAYSLLHTLVKTRWGEFTEVERSEVTRLSYQHLSQVQHLSRAAWPIKSKAAALLAAVVRQQGPGAYEALVPQLLAAAGGAAALAEVACLLLQFVSEDLTQYEETVAGEARRQFLSALLASTPSVLPFICQEQYQASSQAQAAGNAEAAAAHSAAVVASVNALAAFSDWAPMARIFALGVVDAASFLLGSPDFRDAALEVLRQISSRKRSTETQADYEGLMSRTADALLATAAALARPDMAQELDFEGGLEQFGRRLVATLVAFADLHWGCITSLEKKYGWLQHMLTFTRHPYLQLSNGTLPFWSQMIRESGQPPVNKPAPPDAPPPPAPFLLPPEACQAVVEALASQLLRVVLRAEEVAELPAWADSQAEYKELCSNFRGQIKIIMRGAVSLAPSQGLATGAAAVQQLLATCLAPESSPAAKHVHMEAAVFLLECVVQPLAEGPAAQQPALADGLAALLQQMLGIRIDDSVCITLHARGIEAFAKFLRLRPQLAVPVAQASIELMLLQPLGQSGQLPPPPVVDAKWKERATGRISMSKVVLSLAKAAPEAFAPHLEPLVLRIQELWQQGLLAEGERVAWSEGFLAAASGGGMAMQTQVLDWLLRPLHAQWSDPSWLQHVASPEAFAAHYLTFSMTQDAGGRARAAVQSREQRWALFHQLSLFERAMRHTPGADYATLRAGRVPEHPYNAHLQWVMQPVARIIYCLHGLHTPSLQAALAPLAGGFKLDPIERALLVGDDRDSAKRSGVEMSDSIAGTSMAALRHWLRGVRESCYMLLNFSIAHCAAMWAQPEVAAALPHALVSHLEHMQERHLKVLLRHVLNHAVVACPPAYRRAWLAPLLLALVPHMQRRLLAGWAAKGQQDAAAAAGTGQPAAAGGGALQGAASAAAAQDQQLSDELVKEALLRDVTREHLNMLAKLTERGTAGAPAGPGTGADAAGPAAAAAAAIPGPETESGLEFLWSVDAQVAQAAVATAIEAVGWPDTEGARKAVLVCRFVAQLAESSRPELEVVVCSAMLRSAIMSLVQVSKISIQADVLSLIRAILVTWLGRSGLAKDTLLALPHITPQVLQEFHAALHATGSEKEQRNLVKTLLCATGDEGVVKVLNAVSKVPPLRVAEPRQRAPGQPNDDGEFLRSVGATLDL